MTVRVLNPLASSVNIVYGEESVPLEHEHAGVWVGVLPGAGNGTNRSRLPARGASTTARNRSSSTTPTASCPRSARSTCTSSARAGTSSSGRSSARACTTTTAPLGETVSGTSFAVWAPYARGVRVNGRLQRLGRPRAPDAPARAVGRLGAVRARRRLRHRYKFEILGADGEWREKADPMAFHTEVPPATGSVVFESTYVWSDDEWMAERAARQPVAEPMTVYEMHLGSWRSATAPDLRRARRRAGPATSPTSASPTSSSCR